VCEAALECRKRCCARRGKRLEVRQRSPTAGQGRQHEAATSALGTSWEGVELLLLGSKKKVQMEEARQQAQGQVFGGEAGWCREVLRQEGEAQERLQGAGC
jgi:hypothetical protein